MGLERRRPCSASAYWGGFIAAIFLLLQLRQQIGPVAATPHLEPAHDGDLTKSVSFGEFTDDDGSKAGGSDDNSTTMSASPALFSEAWEEQHLAGAVGCDLGRKRYFWRQCGLGSNILREQTTYGRKGSGALEQYIRTYPSISVYCDVPSLTDTSKDAGDLIEALTCRAPTDHCPMSDSLFF